ncbi:MAG TPA: CDP-diacylglycerol--serine O-phosphatidyltransferase [Bacteroidales bacterium]|nr:CDP-diacylglycerol--serine O-phosphatidyltransferase [Bacteroidales bacterium]
MKHIPNFITSLNLASGFISIIFVLNGDLVTASWIILAAMVFDFLDGFMARLLNSYSAIGKELDSLADLVSFGVAPAIIIYKMLARSLELPEPLVINQDSLPSFLIICSTALMPVCAGLRLAIFNTDETQTRSFKGLPTPANALAVISFVIASHYSGPGFSSWFTGSPVALVILTIILPLLMVSRIPLLSLKTTHLKFRGNEGRYILIIMVVTAFIIGGTGAAPLIIPLYIIASLISLLFK